MGKSGNEGLAVAGLELVKLRVIDQSGDHLVDVVALAEVR